MTAPPRAVFRRRALGVTVGRDAPKWLTLGLSRIDPRCGETLLELGARQADRHRRLGDLADRGIVERNAMGPALRARAPLDVARQQHLAARRGRRRRFDPFEKAVDLGIECGAPTGYSGCGMNCSG